MPESFSRTSESSCAASAYDDARIRVASAAPTRLRSGGSRGDPKDVKLDPSQEAGDGACDAEEVRRRSRRTPTTRAISTCRCLTCVPLHLVLDTTSAVALTPNSENLSSKLTHRWRDLVADNRDQLALDAAPEPGKRRDVGRCVAKPIKGPQLPSPATSLG